LLFTFRLTDGTDEHLKLILNEMLAIPLAVNIPTPNARKTCSLNISLLQVQRLPYVVGDPAKDEIAVAIKREVEGELGKEGKRVRK
jgi:hypothetical protein